MTDHGTQAPIGRRLVDAFARMHVNVRGETLRMEGAHRAQWLAAWLGERERELAPSVALAFGRLLDEPSLPDEWRTMLNEAIHPEHDVNAILDILLFFISGVVQLGAYTAPLAQNTVNQLWQAHRDMPLDLGVLIAGYRQGAFTFADAAELAGMHGISEGLFEKAFEAQLSPPPVETLITLVRRKKLDASAMLAGFDRLGIDPDYKNQVAELLYGPPSPEAAILGVVQNHLDEQSARNIMLANGLDDGAYPWLYANMGRPPGTGQMIDAWNRGVAGVTQAVVEQAIRESDIKDKYVPVLVGLREHLLPQKTVVAGVHQGVISDALAAGMLAKLGISAQNAAFLIQEGHNNKITAHKQLSVSQIETAYRDGSIDRAQALAHLVALNYIDADANFILDLVDVAWQQALHAATIARVKALYLGHHIDRATASNDLDAASVSAPHRDLYLQQWDLVRATPTRELSESQAATAYRKLLIGEADFRTRLAALGYIAADIDLIVQLNPVHITEAQALAAYVANVITETQLRARLAEMGLAAGEQDVLLATHPRIAPKAP